MKSASPPTTPSSTSLPAPSCRPARAEAQRDELAFLPAALEIVETPPSPIGRAIGGDRSSLLFCLALGLGLLGQDRHRRDRRRARSSRPAAPRSIQPFETGVVRAIHVRDGQAVKAGEVLIELDPTMTEAELNHLQQRPLAAQLDVAR